ncbi:MAG: DUF3089 domain-containing protein [Bacteroidota bacterium]
MAFFQFWQLPTNKGFLCPILLLLLSCQFACSRRAAPKQPFSTYPISPAPDYSHPSAWSCLPDKEDFADGTPAGTNPEAQATASVDVFFIHPTTFNRKKAWNASVLDQETNAKTDEWAIKHQASIFNASGKVYAPRYRQMVFRGFFGEDSLSRQQALDLAYQDVRRAFEVYLDQYNQGRPILIAGHSQGTVHGIRLLKEFFDGQPLSEQLVAAYLPGWPITERNFGDLPFCERPEQTGCVVSWASWKTGAEPEGMDTYYRDAVVVNPITWQLDTTLAPKSAHKGYLSIRYKKLRPQHVDAQVYQGILWVSSPFRISPTKNYHVGDFNLFWEDVRQNVALRVEEYLKE